MARKKKNGNEAEKKHTKGDENKLDERKGRGEKGIQEKRGENRGGGGKERRER